MTRHRHLYLAAILIGTSLVGCARIGSISEQYEIEDYHVPRLLPNASSDKNPTFIVYGDTQPAWRVYDGFIKPENWLTPRLLLSPSYTTYWLANGIIGTFNHVRSVPDYGKKHRTMMRDVVYARSKRDRLDFILNTGDNMGQDGRRPGQWSIFLQENLIDHPLLNEIPYVPTPGNHERAYDPNFGAQNYQDVFEFGHFFKLEYPDLDLFVVNSDVLIDYRDDIPANVQDSLYMRWYLSGDPDNPGWLESEISKSQKAFKVVSMHHCPLSFGHHWKDWYKPAWGNDQAGKRKELLNLFRENGVQVIFSGHDHLYQHNLLSSPAPQQDVHLIVSSGGGAPIRSEFSERKKTALRNKYADEGYDIEALMIAEVHHYCLVSIDEDQMIIKTYAVKSRVPGYEKLIDEIAIDNPKSLVNR